jgi:hypothetical protein
MEGKNHLTYKRASIKIIMDFWSERYKQEKSVHEVFKVWKGKKKNSL